MTTIRCPQCRKVAATAGADGLWHPWDEDLGRELDARWTASAAEADEAGPPFLVAVPPERDLMVRTKVWPPNPTGVDVGRHAEFRCPAGHLVPVRATR